MVVLLSLKHSLYSVAQMFDYCLNFEPGYVLDQKRMLGDSDLVHYSESMYSGTHSSTLVRSLLPDPAACTSHSASDSHTILLERRANCVHFHSYFAYPPAPLAGLVRTNSASKRCTDLIVGYRPSACGSRRGSRNLLDLFLQHNSVIAGP